MTLEDLKAEFQKLEAGAKAEFTKFVAGEPSWVADHPWLAIFVPLAIGLVLGFAFRGSTCG